MDLTDGTYVGYEGILSSNNRPEGEVTVHMGNADRAQWPLPQRGRFGLKSMNTFLFSAVINRLGAGLQPHKKSARRRTRSGGPRPARTGAERRHRTFEPWQGSKKRTIPIWYRSFFKRETGIEPATPSLARRCSTAEPLAHVLQTSYNIL